jgi:RimJ/RimL family protein N-acetyltransferase
MIFVRASELNGRQIHTQKQIIFVVYGFGIEKRMHVLSPSHNPPIIDKTPVLIGENVQLRPLREGDLAKRVDLLCDPFWHRLHGSTRMVALSDPEVRDANAALMVQPYTWAIERAGKCVGVISLSGFNPPLGKSGVVGIDIFEAKDRGQGNGLDALEVFLRYAFKQLKLQWLKLEVHQDNPAARLYRRLGFKRLDVPLPDRPKMLVMVLPAHKYDALGQTP